MGRLEFKESLRGRAVLADMSKDAYINMAALQVAHQLARAFYFEKKWPREGVGHVTNIIEVCEQKR